MTFDKVMVTGGAGFIGSHTVDALLDQGVEVWVLDDLSSGCLRNLQTSRKNRRLHFRKGTITQFKTVKSLAGKVDAIIHLTAIVSPYVSVKKPEIANEVNVSGTLNVLRAALKKQVSRVVFASSSSVYGNASLMPVSEDQSLNPITPYGVSKLSAEKYCRVFSNTYDLSTISLRYFNVYGERQSANPYSGVIAIFAKQLAKGLQPTIYGDGEQTRDFVHVSDVARANLQALRTEGGIGDAFNIGTGRATTINQLFTALTQLIKRPDISPAYSAERQGDIRQSYADLTRSRAVLGFDPKIEFTRGLELLTKSLPKLAK